jgi:hypothetical protein
MTATTEGTRALIKILCDADARTISPLVMDTAGQYTPHTLAKLSVMKKEAAQNHNTLSREENNLNVF